MTNYVRKLLAASKYSIGSCIAFLSVLQFLVLAARLAAYPLSIPPVKRWIPTPGSYYFSTNSKIVIPLESKANLLELAQLLSKELSEIDGNHHAVVNGKPHADDIFIAISKSNRPMVVDKYKITIGKYVSISAETASGAFYGTRTLLQYLRQSSKIECGSGEDWPDYPMRGLMVDVGRKYFTLNWLLNEVRDMSFFKLNTLHLHLSDNTGFRIESISHPELTANTKPFYSYEDMHRLIQTAKSYHVEIIPEIDIPAHCGAILKVYPDLRLRDKDGNYLYDKLDISKPLAYVLIKDLIREYSALFPGRQWHIGGDEFLHPAEFNDYPQLLKFAKKKMGPLASSVDAYICFVNEIDSILRSYGKHARAWADPFEYLSFTRASAGLHHDISFELWNQYASPKDMIWHGYNISNASFQPLYYNVGDGTNTSAQDIVENWSPNLEFCSARKISIPAFDPHLEGAKYHVWADNPNAENENDIAANIALPLHGVALKCWGTSSHRMGLIPFEKLSKQLEMTTHFKN